MMPIYKPRTAAVEAFKYSYGMSHPMLTRTEYREHPGGPPMGGDDVVPIGKQGQVRGVKVGEYVIVRADGLCEVMSSTLFEAIYEQASS